MNRWLRWTPLLLLPLAAFVVHEEQDPVVIPAGFHWRNNSWLSGEEFNAIADNKLQRVYYKVLDIDWNEIHGAHPISTVHIPWQWRGYDEYTRPNTNSEELVPCIYITNNAILHLDAASTTQLGHNLLRKLRMEAPNGMHGVLLDCDWTATTKARFFELVRMMNDSLDVPLTVTIRLHQYAAPKKTGVPPADRGMLMVYNVGKLQEAIPTNSIFDEATAAPYFKNAPRYPLPLDIALPAYSWGVQFRNGKFLGLVDDETVRDAERWSVIGPAQNSVSQVVSEHRYFPSLHLGDEIRWERIAPDAMAQAADLARTAVNTDTFSVAFFEIGARTFQELKADEVRTVLERFGSVRHISGADVFNADPATDTIVSVHADSAAVIMATDSTMPVTKP
ncbi:MAG TPA: hypothetical protein PK760_03215 [Flavobacteriales bacterium]|nr:hypothetical protein [Flavobacteriales bacterium]